MFDDSLFLFLVITTVGLLILHLNAKKTLEERGWTGTPAVVALFGMGWFALIPSIALVAGYFKFFRNLC